MSAVSQEQEEYEFVGPEMLKNDRGPCRKFRHWKLKLWLKSFSGFSTAGGGPPENANFET